MSARVLDSDLSRARAAFDAWRSSRRGPGGRLPDRLWQMAASLLDHYELPHVARDLGLDPDRLRQRVAERSPRPRPGSPEPAFLELRALDLTPPRAPIPDSSVQALLERPDGARLTLRLPAEGELLDHLCAAFLRA